MNRKSTRHAPLTKALKMLVYLCDHRFGGTIADLQDEVGISSREIYRYIAAFERAGIPIERTGRPGVHVPGTFRLRDRRWLGQRLGVI